MEIRKKYESLTPLARSGLLWREQPPCTDSDVLYTVAPVGLASLMKGFATKWVYATMVRDLHSDLHKAAMRNPLLSSP